MPKRKRTRASDWDFDELPQLPDGWVWEKAGGDGDPSALRVVHGVETRVHEADCMEFKDKLSITVNCEGGHNSYLKHDHPLRASFVYGIPFEVFVAVRKAVHWWYTNVIPESNNGTPPPPLDEF